MIGDSGPKRYRLVIDFLALLTFVSLTLTSYLFYDRITTSRQSQASTKDAIRTVLCFAQQRAEEDRASTKEQKDRAIVFYTEALKRIDALPCPRVTKQ